jgi:beta-phosphoglucomutase
LAKAEPWDKGDKAVLWDMDGVLVDTGRYHLETWQILASEIGVAFSEEQFWSTFGRRNAEVLRESLGVSDPSEVDRLIARKEEILRGLIEASHLEPFPGVVSLIEGLRARGFRQAVASSSPRENVLAVLRAADLAHRFDSIITSENVSVGKPNPEVFLVAARSVGVEPTRCVVVEDSMVGVQAAKAAGARCIAVTNTWSASELAAADVVVSSLEQVCPDDVEALLSDAVGRRGTGAPQRS